MKTPLKFLVVQQKMIGDVLASTVICECIKHHFPKAVVRMVANENTLPVLKNNPFIDEILVFKREYRENKWEFYRFLNSLKKNRYTAVIDAYGKLESNLISLFVKADKKIAHHKWYSSWIYTHTVYQSPIANGRVPLSISNRLMLLGHIVPDSQFVPHPKLYLSEKESASGQQAVAKLRHDESQKIIMISVLGSSPGKSYPAAYMAKTLDFICSHCDAILVFNYLPEQKEKALNIYNLCSKSTQRQIEIDFYAESLRNFIAVISHCDMIIGNEGGAVNMAKALEVPSFSIFSPFIPKGNWHGAIYADHQAEHLRDYKPELFENLDKKQLRNKSLEIYQSFSPELFEKPLLRFLNDNCGKSAHNAY